MTEQDIKQQVAYRIRETRKAKGLTQKELATLLAVGEPTVNGYESGKQNLTIETLQKIAIALKVSVKDFLQ
ncbi:helix-turn-helix domain-containing protein [Fibrella forsythiae]|uniref:Helix-turn-helix transcriptional regulator n=1 Tax=Fibrella forsythiae TaxID=2817061 RepID=A0ABS3JSL4_9BACT|nr:helix-turn-helix transcriptional regulator [Fibrella forsythiae]MBO0952991.1 helix-turn-helix transcriptional regulator [Fibrella forsythiae]